MRVTRLAHLFAFAAAGLFSQQAFAYTIDVLSPGTLPPPASCGTVVTFDESNIAAQTFLTQSPYSNVPFTVGGATLYGSAVIMNNPTQGSGGLYAQPYGDDSNYMAVLGGGAATIAYSTPKTNFGLYWGSVDTYNSLQFYDGSTLEATISGGDSADGQRRPDELYLQRLCPDQRAAGFHLGRRDFDIEFLRGRQRRRGRPRVFDLGDARHRLRRPRGACDPPRPEEPARTGPRVRLTTKRSGGPAGAGLSRIAATRKRASRATV